MTNGVTKQEAVGGVAGGLLPMLGQAVMKSDVIMTLMLIIALLACVAIRWDLAKLKIKEQENVQQPT